MKPGERWLPVVGFELQYEVSDQGRVRRSGGAARTGKGRGGGARIGRVLKEQPNNAYRAVQIWRDGKHHRPLVHCLVAAAFIGPCPAGKEVNHIDGQKARNVSTNLEYLTRAENNQHAYDTGLRARGAGHSAAKLSESAVRSIRLVHRSGAKGYRPLAREHGVCREAIRAIVLGRTWAHLGD